MNIKKLHRNMCRDLESRLEMDEDDDEMVTRSARKFVHNGVKTRKPIDPKPVVTQLVEAESFDKEEFIREVG